MTTNSKSLHNVDLLKLTYVTSWPNMKRNLIETMRCLVTPRKEECLFWHFTKFCFNVISRQIVEMICWQHVQNTTSRGTNMTAWQNEMLYVRCSIYTNTVRLLCTVQDILTQYVCFLVCLFRATVFTWKTSFSSSKIYRRKLTHSRVHDRVNGGVYWCKGMRGTGLYS